MKFFGKQIKIALVTLLIIVLSVSVINTNECQKKIDTEIKKYQEVYDEKLIKAYDERDLAIQNSESLKVKNIQIEYELKLKNQKVLAMDKDFVEGVLLSSLSLAVGSQSLAAGLSIFILGAIIFGVF